GALRAALALATPALAEPRPRRSRDYLTIPQATRALGGGSQKRIRAWIERGGLPTITVNGQSLIHRQTLFDFVRALPKGQPSQHERTPEELALQQQRDDFIRAGIPADMLGRLEALHEKMEDGEPLSRE